MVFKKIIFQNSLMANETPSRPPPPFMANAILNFHFDYLTPSLSRVPDNYIYWHNPQEKDFTCYFVPCSAEHIFGAIFEVKKRLKSLLKLVFSIGIAKITTPALCRQDICQQLRGKKYETK